MEAKCSNTASYRIGPGGFEPPLPVPKAGKLTSSGASEGRNDAGPGTEAVDALPLRESGSGSRTYTRTDTSAGGGA